MKTKVYANNGHCILFGDTHFSREHKISCKEAMIFFRDNAVKLETETKAIQCELDDLGLDADDDGFFWEIDI